MLHNYLIDISIKMSNSIDFYDKRFYAIIINTMHKIKTTSKINFAITRHFKI